LVLTQKILFAFRLSIFFAALRLRVRQAFKNLPFTVIFKVINSLQNRKQKRRCHV